MDDEFVKPPWEHATSRYRCVTTGLIDALQEDFFAGRELGSLVPGLSRGKAAIIVAETLEADLALKLLPDQLRTDKVKSGRVGDFKRAFLAEISFSVAKQARKMKDEKAEQMWEAAAMAVLEEILRTPTASPMLWYEDIYWDVAWAFRKGETDKVLYWLKCGLAHNLHHNEGNNAANYLRDIADDHLAAKDLDQGLKMLAALLRHDPSDIWTYNAMALTFDDYGLTQFGAEAARRGLDLLKAKGDPDRLHKQLKDCLHKMQASEFQGQEALVAPSVLADLRAALALDFDHGAHRPLGVLCRTLVPDLDRMPVKRAMKPSDFPLPRRETVIKQMTELAAHWSESVDEQGGEAKRIRKRHKRRG